MVDETNEFDEIKTSENNSGEGESMDVTVNTGRTVYDYNLAPNTPKAPPRIDLDGKTVTIEKAEIIMPYKDLAWEKTKSSGKDVKYCTLCLHYNENAQQEFYSGIRVFRRDNDEYSPPTVTRDGKNQASRLWFAYGKYKGKDPNEISLKEFMVFLNSKPKAVIKCGEVSNPATKEIIRKNFVEEFID